MTIDESDFLSRVQSALERAVRQELDRKRRLGQYAVLWRDGQVVLEGPDAPSLEGWPPEVHGLSASP